MVVNILTTKDADIAKVAMFFRAQNIHISFHFIPNHSGEYTNDQILKRVKEFYFSEPTTILALYPFDNKVFKLGVCQIGGCDPILMEVFENESLEKLIGEALTPPLWGGNLVGKSENLGFQV